MPPSLLASPPLTERLVLLIVALMLVGIGLALTGPKKWGIHGLALLTGLATVLDSRYFFFSMHDSIAFFIAIYDPFYNLGMDGGPGIMPFLRSALGLIPQPNSTAVGAFDPTDSPGLAPCKDTHPHCGFLSYYSHHPSWAGVFYSEFVDSADGSRRPAARRQSLLLHIGANSAALVLCFCQVCLIPRTTPAWKRAHRVAGWAAVALTLFGTSVGLSMGLDHAQYEQYGGIWAPIGWASMFGLTVGTLAPGVLAGVRRDIQAHEKWMLRFFGAMWGAFLAFRLLFLVGGRLLVGSSSAVTLLAVWGGAPCGIAAAEWARTRWKRPTGSESGVAKAKKLA